MGWAHHYIEQLQRGAAVSFRPRGDSMQPHIRSGQLVTVEPLRAGRPPAVKDIVLCRVRGTEYLHFVKAVRGGQCLIGNAHGHDNGWTDVKKVFGRVVNVGD